MVKYLVCSLLAALLGLGLFLGMQLLIRNDDVLTKADGQRAYLNFIRVDPADNPPDTKDRKPPPEPPPPEAPPDTPDMASDLEDFTPDLSMSMPSGIGVAVNDGGGPFLGSLQQGDGLSAFDTDVIPVVRVPPVYPRRAKQAKLEGVVTMVVTIRPDGTVADAKVLESDPPRLFDQSALDAMKRWKFRPKIVDGTPVSQRARQTIEFSLGGA